MQIQNGKSPVFSLDGAWSFSFDGVSYSGQVPGDITTDLYRNGLIEDPFYDDNIKKYAWIHERDWTYEKHFVLSKEQAESPAPSLTFLMVDTYSTISLNGQVIGKTDSMFERYTFPVKGILKE